VEEGEGGGRKEKGERRREEGEGRKEKGGRRKEKLGVRAKKRHRAGGADGPARRKGWQPVHPSALRVGEKRAGVRPGGGLGETALPAGRLQSTTLAPCAVGSADGAVRAPKRSSQNTHADIPPTLPFLPTLQLLIPNS